MKFTSTSLLFLLGFGLITALPSREPAKKPSLSDYDASATSSATTPSSVESIQYHKSCGLDIPTQDAWNQGKDKEVNEWVEIHWRKYLSSDKYKSFPLYLRDNFAPGAVASTVWCDGIGSCTLSSCSNLDRSLSIHDCQMAYYVFESISGIEHAYKAMDKAVGEATRYQLGKMKSQVEQFTSAKYIEKRRMERQKQEEVAVAAGVALALVATGIMGAVPLLGEAGMLGSTLAKVGIQVSKETIKKVGQINHITSLMANTFIGLSGLINKIRDNPHLTQDLVELSTMSWNEVAHEANEAINQDLLDLMIGATNSQGQTLPQLIKSGQFLTVDPRMYMSLRGVIEKYYQAALVNSLWHFERAYILDTDSKYGNCLTDYRGPSESRVCLPEYPSRTYWLFSIDQSEEYDRSHDDQALVHGPRDYRNFFENPNFYGLTKEDIVRSSLWIDANNFEGKVGPNQPDVMRLMHSGIDAHKDLGSVPGAFALPRCRNPGGEAISSVWQKRGRNYLCKCGESAWKEKHFDFSKDQTRKFLELTGFKFSEDWEDYCSDHNHCHGENSIDWNFKSGPGEEKIPKKLKHPFKKCKVSKKHEIGRPVEGDRDAEKGKREIEKSTWQEMQRAQLEYWAQEMEMRQMEVEREREEYLASLLKPVKFRV